MKSSLKLTFSAIMASLATVTMLLSFFPYLTYAVPAVAGLFIMVVVIEIDKKYALLSYVASSFLVFLFAENESKLMYIFLLGYYPILKAVIDKKTGKVLQWILKIITFNISVLLVYFVFASLFGVDVESFGTFGKFSAVIFLIFGNFVFVLYDITVSKMAMFYIYKLQPKIRKIFRF